MRAFHITTDFFHITVLHMSYAKFIIIFSLKFVYEPSIYLS